MKYLNSLQNALVTILENDTNAHILGEDICAPYGGAFKVTIKASKKFPDRVLNTPICEASIIGIGTGMAIRGFPTIIEIMFGDFLLIAADQIINEAAKFKAMFDQRMNVPLVIRTPMGAGRGYGPVHSQSLEKFFLGISGLKVVSPSHYHNPGQLLEHSVNINTPVLFVEHKLLYPKNISTSMSLGNDQGFEIVSAKNHENSTQSDIVLIGYGGMSKVIEEAMTSLAYEEIIATAIFPSLISSTSQKLIDIILQETPPGCPIVIIDEVEKEFGWAVQLAYSLMNAGISNSKIKIVSRKCDIIPTCYSLEQELIVKVDDITQATYQALGLL